MLDPDEVFLADHPEYREILNGEMAPKVGERAAADAPPRDLADAAAGNASQTYSRDKRLDEAEIFMNTEPEFEAAVKAIDAKDLKKAVEEFHKVDVKVRTKSPFEYELVWARINALKEAWSEVEGITRSLMIRFQHELLCISLLIEALFAQNKLDEAEETRLKAVNFFGAEARWVIRKAVILLHCAKSFSHEEPVLTDPSLETALLRCIDV